jgi:hypothetical protein
MMISFGTQNQLRSLGLKILKEGNEPNEGCANPSFSKILPKERKKQSRSAKPLR